MRSSGSRSVVVAVDGLEGAGKTTVVGAVAAAMEGSVSIAHTSVFRDSGQTTVGAVPIGEVLYEIALRPEHGTDETGRQLLLATAARLHYLKRLPQLRSSEGLILSERSMLSVLAYSAAVGPEAERMAAWATRGLKAEDIIVLIDVRAQTSVSRRQAKDFGGAAQLDSLTNRTAGFQDRVRKEFLRLAQEWGSRVVLIDGEQSPALVCREALRLVSRWLK
jgi:thymidylate kinase